MSIEDILLIFAYIGLFVLFLFTYLAYSKKSLTNTKAVKPTKIKMWDLRPEQCKHKHGFLFVRNKGNHSHWRCVRCGTVLRKPYTVSFPKEEGEEAANASVEHFVRDI